MADEWIRIGTVKAVNPARRELRIAVDGVARDMVNGLKWADIRLADESRIRCKVDLVRQHADLALVTLGAGVPRDDVARMKGGALMVSREQLAAERAGFALDELVDCKVFDEHGGLLGVVRDAFRTPAHGVLEIERPGGGSLLLPAIDEVLVHVDVAEGKLVVRDIEPFAVTDED